MDGAVSGMSPVEYFVEEPTAGSFATTKSGGAKNAGTRSIKAASS